MEQTAVGLAIELIKKDYQVNGRLRLAYVMQVLEQAKEMEKEQKILLVEELKNYTKEAQCILGNDEREASEFVEIFNNTTFKSE